ncbi:MAG: hypothetical protein ACTSYC_02430 [Promethearchaeota archaeon]
MEYQIKEKKQEKENTDKNMTEKKEIVICHAKRTAIGTFGGSLLPYNASQLLSFLILILIKDCNLIKDCGPGLTKIYHLLSSVIHNQ